ncbi:hypothetical protein BVRB_8g190690 [Beta vulgaris subsp. vulgaris]|nr:hypothetical protein BVRB_8g190690 [Beta vulgaris subsp. vulgaris]
MFDGFCLCFEFSHVSINKTLAVFLSSPLPQQNPSGAVTQQGIADRLRRFGTVAVKPLPPFPFSANSSSMVF